MKPSGIRNVALIGPHGAGKSTLLEAMLAAIKAIPAKGSVEKGTSVSGADPEETARQMSLGVTVASANWDAGRLNLIDTPGMGDFQHEVALGLSAADAAVLVLNTTKGVDPTVQRLYRMARDHHLPVMVFLNGVDREGTRDYAELHDEIRSQLDPHAVPLDLPIGAGSNLAGEIDLIPRKRWYFSPGGGQTSGTDEIPPELADAVNQYRTELVEAVAELHDELLERYLGGEEISDAELIAALRADVEAGKLVPMLAGSANASLGVTELLEAVFDLFPTPEEAVMPPLVDPDGAQQLDLKCDASAPLAMSIFSTLSDPYQGKISVVRVYSGALEGDSALWDPNRGDSERAGRLFKMMGHKTVPVDRLVAGEIGAMLKLKHALTGDTLLAENHPLRNGRLELPMPAAGMWSVAIAPASKQDESRLAIALGKMREEDPGLTISLEPRTHRTVIGAQGPVHLEVALARLSHRHHVELIQAPPQVPYRETIRTKAEAQGRHKKQTGGRGQFGDVWLRLEPRPRGSGFEFVDAVVGGAVPRNFIPAVEKGVREMLDTGILAGYPLVDLRVTLYDGSSHSVDSSEAAFKTAAHLGMKAAFEAANPVLLEPIMELTIHVPPEVVGDATGDLTSRRGSVMGLDGGTIQAKLPVAELPGFMTSMQRYARGEGTVESRMAGYEEVAPDQQARLLAEWKAQEAVAH